MARTIVAIAMATRNNQGRWARICFPSLSSRAILTRLRQFPSARDVVLVRVLHVACTRRVGPHLRSSLLRPHRGVSLFNFVPIRLCPQRPASTQIRRTTHSYAEGVRGGWGHTFVLRLSSASPRKPLQLCDLCVRARNARLRRRLSGRRKRHLTSRLRYVQG
jgi:hypothetical protein